MRHECYFCHTKTIERLIEKFKPEDNIAEDIILTINEILKDNWELNNPSLSTLIHRTISNKINNANLYKEEKFYANNLILNNYNKWKDLIYRNADPVRMAVKLAVIGNVIDYGSHSIEDDIEAQIKRLLNETFAIDESEELFIEIRNAKTILYLGDNAGEIVFDKLFIEMIKHPDITYAVRGNAVINDVTSDDAEQVKINEVCKVITNGYDAPSTIFSNCSEEFKQIFNNAELVISKGQGNFEGLMNIEAKNIFFLLMAKCKPIAELIGVNKGSLVIKKK